jgi:hypothetical protein
MKTFAVERGVPNVNVAHLVALQRAQSSSMTGSPNEVSRSAG